MKFLITGAIRSASGPRRLLTFTLLFLVLFVITHGLREYYHSGVTPAQIRVNLFGLKSAAPGSEVAMGSPPSPLLILEDLHIDLLLYSLTLLFLGSVFLQTRAPLPLKMRLFTLLSILALIYVLARSAPLHSVLGSWIVSRETYLHFFAWIVSGGYFLFHGGLVLTLLYSLVDLYRDATRT